MELLGFAWLAIIEYPERSIVHVITMMYIPTRILMFPLKNSLVAHLFDFQLQNTSSGPICGMIVAR